MTQSNQPPVEPSRPPMQRDSRRAATILLAEDDEDMRCLLSTRLRHEGYQVRECRDGLELIDLMESILREEVPVADLIISDIRMPYLTGLEMLQELRLCRRIKVPIVLITAFGDARAHQEAQRLGAAALVDKPFEFARLLEIITSALTTSAPGRGSATELTDKKEATDKKKEQAPCQDVRTA